MSGSAVLFFDKKDKELNRAKTKQSMNTNIMNLSSVIREFVPTDFVLQDYNFINCFLRNLTLCYGSLDFISISEV